MIKSIIRDIDIGKHKIAIYVPDESEIKEWYTNTDPKPHFPYWAKIWPAAIALSAYIIDQQNTFKGKRIVELGAGLGLPSLIAAKYATSVLITDYRPEPLTYVLDTIKHYQYTNCYTAVCNWKNIVELPEADILLLSDINYAPDDFSNIIDVIMFYIKKGTTIFLATPQRMAGRDFINTIEKLVKQTMSKFVKIDGADIAISIFIL